MKPVLTDKFETAISYAFQLHTLQTRKDSNTPYFAHLMAVASMVIENGGSESAAIAGLLHDAAEDQGGKDTLDEIRNTFGNRVAELVKACSDTLESPKPPWKPRKEAYLEKIKSADQEVILITLADKLHNARSIYRDLQLIGSEIWSSFNGGREGTLWYYRSLSNLLKDSAYPFLSTEFSRVVEALHNSGNQE